jgi:uncharacterized protein YcbX
MPNVVALYRYPVKGFTAEIRQFLDILPDGRAAGDRVLAFRFANSPVPDADWSSKHECVALVNTPALARLTVAYDEAGRRLRIVAGHVPLVEARLDPAGRAQLAAAVADYVLECGENPLSAHPERLPLRLVGDGVTPRYQDNVAGQVTLHSRASLAAVAQAADDEGLSEVRFRSNVAIDGAGAWEEQQWIGRRMRIGDVTFEVVAPKTRCLATHANPRTGERDVAMMPLLLRVFAAERPTFAVAMLPREGGGRIEVGDEVRVLR